MPNLYTHSTSRKPVTLRFFKNMPDLSTDFSPSIVCCQPYQVSFFIENAVNSVVQEKKGLFALQA